MAYLGTSGQLLVLSTSTNPLGASPVPTGPPVVTISGVSTTCPNYASQNTDLFIILPTIQLNNTAIITVEVPGVTTSVPVNNYTGTPTIPQTIPPKTITSKLIIGMNIFGPSYYCGAQIYSNMIRYAGLAGGIIWVGATTSQAVTDVNARGWPVSLPVGDTQARTNFGQNLLIQTGKYLLRWAGGAEPTITLVGFTLGITGIASDGLSYRVLNLTVPRTGLGFLYVAVPIDLVELWSPGTWDTATFLPTEYWHPNWVDFYSSFKILRTSTLDSNNSNISKYDDLKPPQNITDTAQGYIVTSKVTSVVPSTSVFLSVPYKGTPVYLITHNSPNDPFVSGQQTSLDWRIIERVSPTTFHLATDTPPTVGQAFTLIVSQYYSPESIWDIAKASNQSIWISTPALLCKQGIRDLALRHLSSSRPGTPFYVGGPNEMWDSGEFAQAAYANSFGTTTGPVGGGQLWGMAYLTWQTHAIFREVFAAAGRSGDLKCVLESQYIMYLPYAKDLVAFYLSLSGGIYPDIYAVAPYYGRVPSALYSVLTPDGVLDAMERDLTSSWGQNYYLSQCQQVVAGTPMALACYECGSNQSQGNSSYLSVMAAAQRSPRITFQHWQHMTLLVQYGFTICNHFESVGDPWTSSDLWSAQEYFGQPQSEAPNLLALTEWNSSPT